MWPGPPKTRQTTLGGEVSMLEVLKEMKDMRSEENQNLDKLNHKIENVEREMSLIMEENVELKNCVKRLESKVEMLDRAARRNNIILYNVVYSSDDTENTVRDIFRSNLNIDEDIDIQHVHRMPSAKTTILVTLGKPTQRIRILQSAKHLKGSYISISEDFTEQTRAVRKKLVPHLKRAKGDGKFSVMKFDKLQIENEIFRLDEAADKLVKVRTLKPRTGTNQKENKPIATRPRPIRNSSKTAFNFETWMCDNDDIVFPGYIQLRKTRQKSKGAFRNSGGILALVSTEISNRITTHQSVSDNILWLILRLENIVLILGVVYFSPPNSSIYSEEPIFSILEDECCQLRSIYPNSHLIIQGDLNARTGNGHSKDIIENDDPKYLPIDDDFEYDVDWDIPRVSQDPIINSRGKQLLDFCKVNGFRICNGRLHSDKDKGKISGLANNGQSVVDYVLCGSETMKLFSNFDILPEIEHTHMPISYQLTLKVDRNINDSEFNANKPKLIWNVNKFEEYVQNWESVRTEIDNIRQYSDVQAAYTEFVNILQTTSKCFNLRLPSANKPKVDWFNSDCQEARSEVRKHLRRFHISNSVADRELYSYSCKYYKSLCKDRSEKAFYAFCSSLEETLRAHDGKRFWRAIKPKTIVNKNSISATDWTHHFIQHFSGVDISPEFKQFHDEIENFVDSIKIDENLETFEDNPLNNEISLGEINNAISEIQNGKAPGYDGVPIELFKNAPQICMDILHFLFNCILKTEKVGAFKEFEKRQRMTTMENRPWTFGGRAKKRSAKLKTPQINTYFKQIQKCQELYSKLKLENTESKLITAPFPKIQTREKTFLSLPAQRKSIGTSFLTQKFEAQSVKTNSSDDIRRQDTDRRRHSRMTPKRLCEYLQSKGFGQPRMLTSSYMKRPNETVIKSNPLPFFKILPKNNSKQSKFKSKTNCLEQNSKATESVRKESLETFTPLRKNKEEESNECGNSLCLIQTPLTRKERFERIEAWLEDVNNTDREIPSRDSDSDNVTIEEIVVLDPMSRQNSTTRINSVPS
ncbi:hypothetical protein LOTGIDRAFT_155952 [Lottia gigantea]|uniref:Endonuclease/exonuclease/phosphatase domain-containing protein n=1 Tax=Lottia gigantea TaxID=225164 RepID=V3ZPW6_LOTGI|nr:hypothetical protein LOTGIDRAFT_155952 [Lottia gigantea]ESO82911.1 hypothetical protein LOTGIDRAFT_155952 [Lottia gigantea]